ncbi:MAG: hypothetical protein HGGPFJEG_00448 [Ignavibacteria bacterium]|nr:hypothetical protein [Ignavibacteria bacterium]
MTKITVETSVNAALEKVWDCWTIPKHIVNWNFALDEWCCPKAENDLKENGRFSYTMSSKDGKMSFDFGGIYTRIKPMELIHYTLGDGRKVEISFRYDGKNTILTETFETEEVNPEEMQKNGWQAILDNFKKYTESC